MLEEEEIKKILSQAHVSNNQEFQKQAVDKAALYGKSAITHLINLKNQLSNDEMATVKAQGISKLIHQK